MNVSRGVLVKRHRLKQNVVRSGSRGDFIDQINNLVNYCSNFKRVWVHLLTDFTFKSLPIERSHILVSSTWWFFLFLGQNPCFKALEMD